MATCTKIQHNPDSARVGTVPLKQQEIIYVRTSALMNLVGPGRKQKAELERNYNCVCSSVSPHHNLELNGAWTGWRITRGANPGESNIEGAIECIRMLTGTRNFSRTLPFEGDLPEIKPQPMAQSPMAIEVHTPKGIRTSNPSTPVSNSTPSPAASLKTSPSGSLRNTPNQTHQTHELCADSPQPNQIPKPAPNAVSSPNGKHRASALEERQLSSSSLQVLEDEVSMAYENQVKGLKLQKAELANRQEALEVHLQGVLLAQREHKRRRIETAVEAARKRAYEDAQLEYPGPLWAPA